MSELEQTKKVLDVIANLINEKETCTYRYLIYDLLEFKEDAYSELISGLTITNFLVYVKEQDKEIKRLKEEYMILQNASDEVEEEKDKEIERLNNDIKVLLKENENKEKVIKAQDNIINKAIEYIEQLTNDEESIELMDINSLVQKELLEILKGVDKE